MHRVIGVVNRQDQVLLARRPSSGLLADMWVELPPGADPKSFLTTWLNEELGLETKEWEPLTRLEHAYSHFSVSAQVFAGTWQSGQPQASLYPKQSWVPGADLDTLPMGKVDRIIANLIKAIRNP